MKISLKHPGDVIPKTINVRCPHCHHYGALTRPLSHNDVGSFLKQGNFLQYVLGIRKCPNPLCESQIFFVTDAFHTVLQTWPQETIPFDSSNIPKRVLTAFEEAIKCHSSACYIASAIMIRKTLEEICTDRKATGSNLKSRLKNLGSQIVLPQELIVGMDELRLLGNDAAHIEAQTFSEIGKNEIEVSIEFAKEILKGVYQYENLLSRLRSLKAAGDPPPQQP